MGPSRRVAPAPAEDATEQQKPRPRRPTRIAPSLTPSPDAVKQPPPGWLQDTPAADAKQPPRWLQDTPAASPDGPAPKPRWLQDTPDAPRHATEDDDDATLDRPASPPDWLSPDQPKVSDEEDESDPYATPANLGPDSDDDDMRVVSPSPSPVEVIDTSKRPVRELRQMAQELGVDVTNVVEKGEMVAAIRAARPPPVEVEDEDESDGPGEHMSVLFELLPFYRQGDASTDAVVNRAVSATLQDDLRAVDDEGATPLVVCAQYGHEDLVEALLERGADVDAAAHSGCTALVYACGASQASFSERLVEKLLDHGADPNIPELHHGSRALHYLAATGHERLCRELVMRGADAAAKDYGGWAPADYAADAGHGACAEVLRQLARPPQTPKTPHQVDHLEREVEKRQAVESELAAAQKARKDAEADLDDALRRVDVLEAEAAALRRKCDDQAHDLSYARETGASAAQGSDARIAQLERELAAARAHNEEAARAHAADASSQNDAARKAVEELTATFESQRQHLVDARTQAEAQLVLAIDRTDASAAAHVALLNELRGEAAAAVRDRDALQKSSERQVLNAERRCEHAEKVSAEAERRAAAAEEAAEARVQALEEHIARADAVDRRNAQLDRDLVREVKRRKDLHNALEDLKGRIRVYLRVRPMNDKEKTAHEVCCERSGQTGVVVKRPDRKPPQDRQHFEFDRVFAGEAAQDAVFADVKALVLSCVDGFNVCIFAYGQSGSGKTYTMAGGGGPVRDAVDLESWAVAASAGVIPRSCVEIFRVLDERAALNSYEVELSMYECYIETRCATSSRTARTRSPCSCFCVLRLRDGVEVHAVDATLRLCDGVEVPRHRRDGITHRSMCPHRSVKLAQHTRDGLAAVEGGVCRQATSLEELVALLDKGLEQRAVAHTELNAESSRSHLLVSIVLTSTNRRSGKKTRGKLMLVDLAGSERVEKSGVQGDELKEAASINKSQRHRRRHRGLVPKVEARALPEPPADDAHVR